MTKGICHPPFQFLAHGSWWFFESRVDEFDHPWPLALLAAISPITNEQLTQGAHSCSWRKGLQDLHTGPAFARKQLNGPIQTLTMGSMRPQRLVAHFDTANGRTPVWSTKNIKRISETAWIDRRLMIAFFVHTQVHYADWDLPWVHTPLKTDMYPTRNGFGQSCHMGNIDYWNSLSKLCNVYPGLVSPSYWL